DHSDNPWKHEFHKIETRQWAARLFSAKHRRHGSAHPTPKQDQKHERHRKRTKETPLITEKFNHITLPNRYDRFHQRPLLLCPFDTVSSRISRPVNFKKTSFKVGRLKFTVKISIGNSLTKRTNNSLPFSTLNVNFSPVRLTSCPYVSLIIFSASSLSVVSISMISPPTFVLSASGVSSAMSSP